MLAYKTGVRVKRRTAALSHIEACLLHTQTRLGYPDVVVITSINDGVHLETSAHYRDAAVDVRTRSGHAMGGMGTREQTAQFRDALAHALGSWFTVLLEGLGTTQEHLHVQVKRGESYP